MLQPKRTKYKKQRKGKYPTGISSKYYLTTNNAYSIQSVSSGCVSSKQLEATRKALARKTSRQIKLRICIFPDIPRTKKPIEVRMGKGKGSVDHWIYKVKPGRILFELYSNDESVIKEAYAYAKGKLGVQTSLIRLNL